MNRYWCSYFISISYPSAFIASNNCFLISISTFLSSIIFIFIPKNVWLFSLVTNNFPWFFSVSWITLYYFHFHMRIFLWFTYHAKVHYLPFTVLFAPHISYRYSSKHLSINISEYNFCHCIENSMHPYMARNSNIYRILCPFLYPMFLLCFVLIWHSLYMNFPLILNKTVFHFRISAF